MNRKLIFAITAVILLLAVGSWWAFQSAKQCRTEVNTVMYRIPADISEEVRIVHLTDLHSWKFGQENEKLVKLVEQQTPDLILMTGDMLDQSDESADVVCALIEKLTSISPVYYGYGNHEMSWMSRTGADLTPILSDAGATVLDVEYTDISVNGQALRLGGYHGYYRQPGMYDVTAERHATELEFAESFESTDRFKILLCHIPTAWLDWGYMDDYPVDLVLTGHYHGGQIRLPLIGGLYAPYVGWFPEYTEGLYRGERATCVLSTGLGASPGIPRINNLPQMIVVDLVPQK